MATQHIGRIVTVSLVGGLVVALALVVGPVAGAQEHVISGTVLLTFAASWAVLALLSTRWTASPQRWAAAIAGFMACAGAALLTLEPGGVGIDALGWVWPPLFLALLAGTAIRVRRDLRSRSRAWVVYPLLALYALCAFHSGFASLPAQARDRQRLHYSSARHYRSLRDECAELPTSLAQARSFQGVGDRPLVVVTAARDAQAGWLPLQEEMATLSTNRSHRVVPYTHDALITDQTAAQTSSQAIRDVVHAVRSSAPREKS
jgi:hypothetical protein